MVKQAMPNQEQSGELLKTSWLCWLQGMGGVDQPNHVCPVLGSPGKVFV